MYNDYNLINTPAGTPVNFIPSTVISIGTSASSTFAPGLMYVGVGGNICVVPAGQTNAVTFVGLPSGAILPVYVKAISALTTADSILMCY